jgi:hypothetical protein
MSVVFAKAGVPWTLLSVYLLTWTGPVLRLTWVLVSGLQWACKGRVVSFARLAAVGDTELGTVV